MKAYITDAKPNFLYCVICLLHLGNVTLTFKLHVASVLFAICLQITYAMYIMLKMACNRIFIMLNIGVAQFSSNIQTCFFFN